MKKILLMITLCFSLVTVHPVTHALALAEIKLNSSLNQPLDATIELISANVVELDSLHTSVSRLANQVIGLYRWPHLKVEVIRSEQGRSYLKVTSKDAVREPFVSFLLELGWATGQIKREYTLLIDPQ